MTGLSPRVRGNRPLRTMDGVVIGSIPACAGEPARSSARLVWHRVYPRVCGGTSNPIASASRNTGLSPRVRGNQYRYSIAQYNAGSIPACAGEPSGLMRKTKSGWVYPRVCGGTFEDSLDLIEGWGLSPRVRGNPPRPAENPTPRRSIPACAGEPPCSPVAYHVSKVYPRVCGGTPRRRTPRHPPRGLSPRVRGNPLLFQIELSPLRSIPACAGEPRAVPPVRRDAPVYPRVCGGTRSAAERLGRNQGLSPRVRGNLYCGRACNNRAGSIPACAGEPPTRFLPTEPESVYPRVCGGTQRSAVFCKSTKGLSPRVRGNPPLPLPCILRIGSIPACAGEPSLFDILPHILEVYPRVCGGTHGTLCAFPGLWGLSPRVRGNRCPPYPQLQSRGSIPACAGEPINPTP